MSKRNSSDDLAGMIIALALFFPIIIIVYLVKGIIYLINLAREEKAKKEEEKKYADMLNTNIQEQLIGIDNLEGLQFEKYIGELLKKIGFKNVVITKGSGDFGADIIAEKDGYKYAFQCKRFSSAIGPKPIGEVLRGMNKYKCNRGVVITNNYFTKQAIQEAEVSNVELWDRDIIAYLISCLISDNNIDKGDIMEMETKNENEILETEKCIEKETPIEEKNIKQNIEYIDLTAGYYEVDEDIKEGKYTIEAISNSGLLKVKDINECYKVSEWFGINNPDYIKKFNNLKLKCGDIIKIEDTVTLRFTRLS